MNLPRNFWFGIANTSAFKRNSTTILIVVELFDDRSLGKRGLTSVVRYGSFVALRGWFVLELTIKRNIEDTSKTTQRQVIHPCVFFVTHPNEQSIGMFNADPVAKEIKTIIQKKCFSTNIHLLLIDDLWL